MNICMFLLFIFAVVQEAAVSEEPSIEAVDPSTMDDRYDIVDDIFSMKSLIITSLLVS